MGFVRNFKHSIVNAVANIDYTKLIGFPGLIFASGLEHKRK